MKDVQVVQVEKTAPARETERRKTRVAAYCRVSTKSPAQRTSLEGQLEHYRTFIAANPAWELAGIYCEQGVSATGLRGRTQLRQMVADCEGGKIDLIMTKSISRFARNTADCLQLVRMLDRLGVSLWFERENIRTDTMGAELLLTVLAALAQDESGSISANLKWGIRKRFAAGTYKPPRVPYGYRRLRGAVVIDRERAEVVRRIFDGMLAGMGADLIAADLNEKGIAAPEGGLWKANTVRSILQNRFYTGDMLLQKTYVDSAYRQRPNKGDLQQFLVEGHHEAIVDRERFDLACAMIRQHAKEYGAKAPGAEEGSRGRESERPRSCFSGRLYCARCGAVMHRQKGAFYRCANHRAGDCPMPNVYEEDVRNTFATLLNKLCWSEGLPETRRVLRLYEQAGAPEAAAEQSEALRQVRELLAQNRERQNRLLERLLAQGFSPQIRAEAAELEAREETLLRRQAHLTGRIRPGTPGAGVDGLRSYVTARGIRPCFLPEDAAAFERLVKRVYVCTGQWIEFHLSCGLVLREGL